MEPLVNSNLHMARWIIPGLVVLHLCVPAAWVVWLAARWKTRNAYSEDSRRRSRRIRNVSLVIAVLLTVLLLAAWLAIIHLFRDVDPVPIPT